MVDVQKVAAGLGITITPAEIAAIEQLIVDAIPLILALLGKSPAPTS